MQGQEPRFTNPKTIQEAVVFGASIGGFTDIVRNTTLLVKAYLAAHFAAAYLRAQSDEEIKRLRALWEAISRD